MSDSKVVKEKDPSNLPETAMRLSLAMQDLTATFEIFVEEVIGVRPVFVLVLGTPGHDNKGTIIQYSANCSRKDGMTLLKDLLKGWEQSQPDIPAHLNPDLNPNKNLH